MGGGAGGGCGVGGFSHSHNQVTGAIIRSRITDDTLRGTEEMLAQSGIDVPKSRPWLEDPDAIKEWRRTQRGSFWIGFIMGALAISVPWAIFWELT